MNIQPASTPSGIGCRISSDCFAASVTIDGLYAAELAYLFGFERAPAFEWTQLQARGDIHIALDAPASPAPTKQLSLDLEDGQVTTSSDQPASIRVQSHHALRPTLFPKSLNLGLSQQWARAGILPVHAAGIAVSGIGIMMLGGKAAGKSTLAAAALVASARVISDDWMLLGIDENGKPTMERLRQFLMLRDCSATRALLSRQANRSFKTWSNRPKSTLAIPHKSQAFPRSHPIDQLWLICRRVPRPEITHTARAGRQTVLPALLAQSMPILFGQHFKTEHSRLEVMLSVCLDAGEVVEVATGMDLVRYPTETLGRLSAAGE